MVKLIDKIGKESVEVSAELLEVTLDQLVDDGFVKDLPVVGTIAKLWGVGKRISEAFFLKKILIFLHQVQEISEEKKEKFFKSLELEKEKRKLDETLLVYLDRYEEAEKAKILGMLFIEYLENRIDNDMFYRLANIVDKAYVNDLLKFKQFQIFELSDVTKSHLSDLGLLHKSVNSIPNVDLIKKKFGIKGKLEVTMSVDDIEYFLTPLGNSFKHSIKNLK